MVIAFRETVYKWNTLRAMTNVDKEVSAVTGRGLDVHQKAHLNPLFLSSTEDVLVKCEGKLLNSTR